MHVLTKVFIVLVSLLAVLLVPLVVVYATNENNYRSRWLSADLQRAAAIQQLTTQEARYQSAVSRKDQEIESYKAQIGGLRATLADREASLVAMQQSLTTAQNTNSQMQARLETLARASEAGTRLTEQLVAEAGNLRDETLDAKRRVVETEDALRQISRQLEVAEAARRQLHEEVQRLNEANAHLDDRVKRYAQLYGSLEDTVRTGAVSTLPPDVRVTAKILNVREQDGVVLAEINAGQRDGVKVGWEMVINDGGVFVGKLRITEVDINRSVGIVDLSANPSGTVRIGQLAEAFPGS